MVHTTTAAVSQSRSAGRVPPHNAEAEESLLGAMLLSKDAIATAVETVAADDFYKPAHAHLFEAIVTLYGAGEPVDPITVAEFLHRAGVLDGLGGKQAVLRIQAATPAASNAGFYARIVADHALLRRLVAVGTEIAELGYTLPEDVTAVLDRAESLVFDVANRRQTTSLRGIHATLQDSLTHLESLFEHDGQATGLPSGFRDLDEVLLGWQPSNLIVVAARPGQGKTAFALGAATHAAVHQHRPVIFFSLEMGYLELTQRILAAEAGINSRLLRTGRIPETDWTNRTPTSSPSSTGTTPTTPDSSEKGIAEIIVAKHRNGPTAKVRLAFLEHLTKFANLKS